MVPSFSGLLRGFRRGTGRGWAMGHSNTSQRREQLRDTDSPCLPTAASSPSCSMMDMSYPASWEGRRSQGRCMPFIRLFSECTEPCLYKNFYLLFMHRPSGRHRNGQLQFECSHCNSGLGRLLPAGRSLPVGYAPISPAPQTLQQQQGWVLFVACKVT